MPTTCLIICLSMIFSLIRISSSLSDCESFNIDQYVRNYNEKFDQKSQRFWEFNEQSNTWVEIKLPYDLVSCINDNCTVVGTIQEGSRKRAMEKKGEEVRFDPYLGRRNGVSLTRMSETSIWITGPSGSLYERFWNGLQWVIAPHALPLFAGRAVSVFIVNQTILALSESGLLYQMQLTEDAQPIWVEFVPEIEKGSKESLKLSSGILSNDRERIYFCTKNGLLLELVGVDPPRWMNHGRPPGADLTAITDADMVRPGLLFTVSAAGDLYEYDQTAKPSWKKHIQVEGLVKNASLASVRACSLPGVVEAHSVSLFLLTMGGELIERRLHQRKWKWVVHGNPNGHPLTSITCTFRDETNPSPNSLFVTTADGFIFEYHIPKFPGSSQDQAVSENWVNHQHPPHAKVAIGIAGLQLQAGRTIFALDDGRLGELHLSGNGGENLGPHSVVSTRRRSMLKYVWSVLDAPESEGWNAEYCTEERGPLNCILGTKDETSDVPTARWRKDSRTQQNYLLPDNAESNNGQSERYGVQYKSIDRNFRLRLMQEGKSFFLVTTDGLTLEYLSSENAWFWLRHEHSMTMRGALGTYNSSLFMVDEHGNLLVRERTNTDLMWINGTAMRRGRPVVSGPPWDVIPGMLQRAKPDDALFFVSRNGRLLHFTVALRQYKWKDCGNPGGTRIGSIIDQERFRENIVLVVGTNGKLYQYNKVTGLWHEHYQSQHLILSRSSGTAVRQSALSLKGSLFMISENGGLVEYHWRSAEGWSWVEHGSPRTNATLVGAPGPCFGGSELFLVGSDGHVYLRYLEHGEWKWRDCGFPNKEMLADGKEDYDEDVEENGKNCDPKVSSTRPIPFTEDSVIFELQDGRLAEIRRAKDKKWRWRRIIGTPTSPCISNFWASWAS